MAIKAKKLIVQFGRLDARYRDPIAFIYENEEGKADLTSTFLMTTKAFKDAHRIIIFPASIILQDHILSIEDSFIKQVAIVDIESYFQAPERFLKLHPQSQGAGLLVVSSKGSFSFKGQQYHFDAPLELITLQIYLYLITEFSYDSLEEIYIDVSSGLNIHIAALMSALYRYVPFVKFKRFLNTENTKVLPFILSSDPIFGKPTSNISIQKSPFKARAFNAFPYKNHESLCKLIRKVFRHEPYRMSLEKLIAKEYFLLHGAFIYGAPLAVMLTDVKVLQEIFVNVGVISILRRLKEYYATAEGADADAISFDINAFTFSLEIAQTLYFCFQHQIEGKHFEFDILEKEEGKYSISNQLLDDTFKTLHQQYSQPVPDYKGEITKHLNSAKNAGKAIPNFTSFASLLSELKPDYKNTSDFNPRNFLAHGGLENNITEIKVNDKKAIICYNESLANTKRDSIIKYMKK